MQREPRSWSRAWAWVWFLLICSLGKLTAQTGVPRPDHVVVVMEENHSFNAIIGSPSAPYINALAQQGALFISSFAIRHPSQPNYVALFSGSLHGLSDDSCPHSLVGPNLGSALLEAGLTFVGYSESMPRDGYRGCSASGGYERKHNPWVNFGVLPGAVNLTYESFPSDYTQLPTVAFVVPNQGNDMHDGSVARGDAWLQANLDSYVRWAMANNSLLVVTWDEGKNGSDNRIATLFVGAMVRPGQYCERIDHYTVLRTLLEMYGLAAFEKATAADPITSPWTAESAPSAVAVAITGPVSGAILPGPATIQLEATATAAGSIVTNVEFFERTHPLGQVGAEPFSLTLSNVAPGDYCFVAKATDALGRRRTSLSIPVQVFNPFPPVKGIYLGLILNPAAPAPEATGLASIAVDARGRFSAKVRAGTKTYRLTGELDSTGQGTARAPMPGPVPPDPGIAARTLEMTLNLDTLHPSNRIDGLLTQISSGPTGSIVSSNAFSSLVAERSPYDARSNAPQAGRYTLLFAGDEEGTVAPGGGSPVSVTIAPGGQVRLAGMLADGTAVSAGSMIAGDGRWPLDISIAHGAGMFSGWILFSGRAPGVDASGCPAWVKPALPESKFYPAGFDRQACLAGSSYLPPARARDRILAWTNGVALFSGGDLSGPFTNRFDLEASGTAVNTDAGVFALKISRSTGLWQGKVTEPASGRSLILHGAILQAEASGRGFVLGTNRSGLMTLEARLANEQ